ncbi:unnamed protein product, partial [marine sediment metagenome]
GDDCLVTVNKGGYYGTGWNTYIYSHNRGINDF